MTDHLTNARDALAEAERQAASGDAGSLVPSMHFHRTQAHALLGILEVLSERIPAYRPKGAPATS